jgi:hypothetical protein
MVWMGTLTQTFLPAISASNARTLERSGVNVEFQVKARTPLVAGRTGQAEACPTKERPDAR